jgi:hypothetical protein
MAAGLERSQNSFSSGNAVLLAGTSIGMRLLQRRRPGLR